MNELEKLKEFILTTQVMAEQGECLMLNVTDILNEIDRLNNLKNNGALGGVSGSLKNEVENLFIDAENALLRLEPDGDNTEAGQIYSVLEIYRDKLLSTDR